MTVIGVKELQQKLRRIQDTTQEKIVAQSIRAAMVPMMKAARANAPQGKDTHRTYKGRLVAPGFLKRNIKLKKIRYRDKTRAGYSLAARGEAFYGKILEKGFTHRGGKQVRANPWLGRAERANRSRIDQGFRQQLLKRINKAAK